MNNNKINTPFQPPKDYFNRLSDQLMEGVKASNREQDLSLNLSVGKALPFSVPSDYFDTLSTRVLSEIHSLDQVVKHLDPLRSRSTFEVPDQYFETLADTVMHQIQHTEKDLVDTSFLQGLSKDTPFEVPKGYFDQSTFVSIDNRSEEGATEEKPKLKLVRNSRKGWKWTNWAAAASVFIIFAIGGVWMFGTEDVGSSSRNPHQLAYNILSDVSNKDIEQYIENDQESFDIYSLMDDASISKKVSDQKVEATTKKILDDISADDIDAYLEYEGI